MRSADERSKLELLLRRIDELRADVVGLLGAANNEEGDDEDVVRLATEHAAEMRRRRAGGR